MRHVWAQPRERLLFVLATCGLVSVLSACVSASGRAPQPNRHAMQPRKEPSLKSEALPPAVSEQGEESASSRRHEPAREAQLIQRVGKAWWCASAGAPIVGAPVLDAQERVYVAAQDGTLHAFERDGRFRFSYTLEGSPLGGAALRPDDGVILIGTSARFVYAINQSGRLHWSFQTLAPVWSGIVPLNASTVTFLGQDHRLYALANNGRARFRVRAPSAPTTPPVVAEGDVVWVGLNGAVARFQSAFRLDRISLGEEFASAPVEQLVAWSSQAVALGKNQALLVSADGKVTAWGRAESLGSDGSMVAWSGGGQLHRRKSGHSASSIDVGIAAHGPLEVQGGVIWMPTDGHGVLRWDGAAEGFESIPLGEGAWRRLSAGPSGNFLVASDDVGRFCAVQHEALSQEVSHP